MGMIKDLRKLCHEIVGSSRLLDIRHADKDKLLDQFYNALKSVGDSWIGDHEWIVKSKYRNSNILRKSLSDRLVEKVLVALDRLIKGMNERLNTIEINNDKKKKKVTSPQSNIPSKRALSPSKSVSKQPFTPRTALIPPRNGRMQALVKMSPIDVKRVAIKQNMCQKEAQSNDVNGDNESVKEKPKSEKERVEKMEKAKEAILEEKDSVKSQTDDKSCSKGSEKSEIVPKSLAPTPPNPGNATLPRPQPLPMASAKGPVAPPPPPPGAAAPVPPPPLPMAPGKGPGAPPPPLPMAPGKGPGAPPPPPLPVAPGKGPGAPPPPPLRLGAKKATGKLKRSSQIGELYRFLRAKIEGKDPKTRSRGAGGSKGGIGSSPAAGKQGMADALAEITKKSAHYQQIEADVQMYMKAINELKIEISNFQSKDMAELQKFHLYIESVLEKLTDETKVLARCEGFPASKFEAIRVAAGLYSKLQGMIKELKNWKIEPPADQVFDKTERYFTKIRREIETLEQIKVEEEKKFKSHNIHFDFGILIQIKESMVDISSGCMELALKEKREAKSASHNAESREVKPCRIKNRTIGWAKTLWRAFQFAFRVYTFAGGHDDRADQLTRELSNEIEVILKNQ